MHLRAGTSGFSYSEWKGPFYPEKTKSKDFLEYYAQKLDCVEINNTFYRMPKPELLRGWAQKVPPGFSFVIKASQRITHHQKLEDCADNVAYLHETSQELGAALGPVLFQLPPYLRLDLTRLRDFLAVLPEGMRAVMEFRHRSWFDDQVFSLLKSSNIALCFSDFDPGSKDDPGLDQPFVATADFGYLRLRRELYEPDDLRAWLRQVRSQGWSQAFVFFKHEPTAPGYALLLRELWSEDEPGP